MKINIASSHRFHLLDLARELSNLGHEVRFYSYVPTNRAIKFGLKTECSHSLFVPALPFLILTRLTNRSFWSVKLLNLALDYFLSWFMKPCDIYIALGTVYKKSFIVAKKKFNATTILEWGSKHIEEQQRIMSEIHGLQQQSKYFTQRSLKGYMIADYISIASDHVKQSFIVRGISEGKLIENPYGVDLSMFKPTELIKDNSYDLLMVGGWSYRKGCDLLSKLCAGSSYKFLHVGPLVDMDFPQHENMTHIDSVDQWQLVNYYAKARVFVLPSREEGLAMVQAQALACGLPIVCSAHTGGRDLQRYINDKSWIVEMQEYTIDALNKCIMKALQLSKTQLGLRAYAGPACEQLTWKAYGERYNQTLEDVQSSKRGRDL